MLWIVEDGDYSDYSVKGIFTSEQNAKDFAAVYGGYVVEREADPLIPELRAGMKRHRVNMLSDGTESEASANLDAYQHRWSDSSLINDLSDQYQLSLWLRQSISASVMATDKKHAIKILNERRAMLLADPRWVDAVKILGSIFRRRSA